LGCLVLLQLSGGSLYILDGNLLSDTWCHIFSAMLCSAIPSVPSVLCCTKAFSFEAVHYFVFLYPCSLCA
jgi:hypothetical protein